MKSLLIALFIAIPLLCEAQRKHHKPTRSHELTIGADNGIIIPHGDSAFFWDQHSHQLNINDTRFIYYKDTWNDLDGPILSVRAADSLGITTVTFARSRVHFLNDSTFTFKMKFK